MKTASTLALGLALALGTSGLVASAPAFAKKEAPAKGPSVNLSKEFRAAMTPIEAAITAKTYDGLLAKLDAVGAMRPCPMRGFTLDTSASMSPRRSTIRRSSARASAK